MAAGGKMTETSSAPFFLGQQEWPGQAHQLVPPGLLQWISPLCQGLWALPCNLDFLQAREDFPLPLATVACGQG